jgi:hydroxyacylglutathione hydrolase
MGTEILRVRAGITNIYILRDRGTILVDPGGPPGGAAALRRVLPLLGTPPRLDLMVITHGHFDHFGAAPRIREATRARTAIHQADAPWLSTGRPVWPAGVTRWGRIVRTALGPVVLRTPSAIFEPDLRLTSEDFDLGPFGVDGRVVHTPGHSPGSVSILLPSGDAFVGDLAMNGLPFSLRPTLGIFAHDPEQMPASWRHLLGLGVRTIHPAHGRPFPAVALRLPQVV